MGSDLKFYDGILIDDDELIHLIWKDVAKSKNKQLKSFFSVDEFFNTNQSIDPKSTIFIDSNLGPNIKGEEVASKIYALGFEKIYLITGYSKESFPNIPFIMGIQGKEPPWI